MTTRARFPLPRRGRTASRPGGTPVTLPVPPSPVWATGTATTQWAADIPWTEWGVGSNTVIGLSQLATEYVLIPVAATKAGIPYNPTSDTVQFAFMPVATQVPQNTDWVSGSWDTDTTNIIYPYSAKCLVGPSGTITLGIGMYVIYVKITDNPEIPVLIGGQLQIS
jgi:hypothetical protein